MIYSKAQPTLYIVMTSYTPLFVGISGEVYAEVLNSSSCAEGGFIIDEWVDDWGRSVKRGCPGSVFQHPHQGPCDEVRPGRTINQDGQESFRPSQVSHDLNVDTGLINPPPFKVNKVNKV